MKTAVSLPDPLFITAEKAARELHLSRSQLYAKALAEFLDRRRTSAVTEKLNELYADAPATIDPGLQRAQLKLLRDENDKW